MNMLNINSHLIAELNNSDYKIDNIDGHNQLLATILT